MLCPGQGVLRGHNMQLAAAFYLQGLLMASPLLHLHGLCLPGAAGL